MTQQDRAALNAAIKTTLWVALLLFLIKIAAYLLSSSAAILSDAAASIVYLAAILFTAHGLSDTRKNPDRTHAGFTKINLFSAGFEGSMIILTGIFTAIVSLVKYFVSSSLGPVEAPTILISLAALIHAGLGFYLIHLGKRSHSLLVESNGRQVLANSYSSIAVVAGLLLYSFYGRQWVDPLCGTLISLYIVHTGIQRLYRSFDGLTDQTADPAVTRQLTELLSQRCAQHGISFRELRHRNDGDRHTVDLHLVFSPKLELGEAHRIAAEIEITLISALSNRAHIITHLESGE